MTDGKQSNEKLLQFVAAIGGALRQFQDAQGQWDAQRELRLSKFRERAVEITDRRRPYCMLLWTCYMTSGVVVTGSGTWQLFSHQGRLFGIVLLLCAGGGLVRYWSVRRALHAPAAHVLINAGVLVALGIVAVTRPQFSPTTMLGTAYGLIMIGQYFRYIRRELLDWRRVTDNLRDEMLTPPWLRPGGSLGEQIYEQVQGPRRSDHSDNSDTTPRPADNVHPTGHDQRPNTGQHALGWLQSESSTALLADTELAESARMIMSLGSRSRDFQAIPEHLRDVIGPSAEALGRAELARRMLDHADVTRNPVLVHAGISLLTAALASTPADDTNRAKMLTLLSIAYQRRSEHGGAASDLDRAIEMAKQAVDATPAEHPDRLSFLSVLGADYFSRFVRSGSVADLDRAIEITGQVVDATPAHHPDRVLCLSTLGGAYWARFERAGARSDLDQAIAIGERIMAAARADHPNRMLFLSLLSAAYLSRFERAAVAADLDRAIEMGEQSIAATPADHPNRSGFLAILVRAYMARFERAGAVADLNRGIELGREAVAAAPPGHPDRSEALSNLGGAYMSRFERTGMVADLDRAIEMGEQAVNGIPADHPLRAGSLSNLGAAYRARFERAGVAADLDRAIEMGEHAVEATPADYPGRTMRLSNLGIVYQRRFAFAGAVADLDRAIEVGGQAVDAVPADHPRRAGLLSNLGAAYRARFERGGMVADLKRAIEVSRQAVDAVPADHPSRARLLSNLGIDYLTRINAGGGGVDRETLSVLATRVTVAFTAPPVERVHAARVVGLLAHAMDEHSLAVELLDAAVALIPWVVPRESGWGDQEHRLSGHHGLVGETIEAHCAINDLVGAVEIAELGRGVLLAAQLDARTDLTDLDDALPELAARLRRVRELLDTPHSNTAVGEPVTDVPDRIEDRKHWWAEHDELLTQIRRHPGFDRFMRPPRLSDLQPALAGGTVIVVNPGRHRSDAIILTHDAEPALVRLPQLAHADVTTHARALLEASYDGGLAGILRRQRVISEILAWLWDVIAHPVLQATPSNSSEGSLPRVWWLPTGLLGLLPLHAAGHPGQPGVLDTVISSYTPTLRTLAYAHTRPRATDRRQLTVALRHTPGLPDLPGTVNEATILHNHHPDLPLLLDSAATTDRVLTALPEATWAHFACHAGIDFTAPSRSGLQLHDAPLTLPQISRLQLTHAELAYLSACSTAHRGFRHADESLHPASAFQLAGFRHVIACLWPLADHTAATAATTFYEHLPDTAAADHAATALHRTTRNLRAQHPDRPDLWAGLIHSGP
ncbi:CHAT domain-containing protein [Nocardia niwae]|uniref:CHAT domain-containing protein n=1 Tax=Nocardia niwae TaxID=626084 RepID=UPI0033DA29CE